ncbi:MAG: DUF3237 family protein [Bacteroidales bacterium]|nr:DUF3237 family protein [Bacteroidales bacterium]
MKKYLFFAALFAVSCLTCKAQMPNTAMFDNMEEVLTIKVNVTGNNSVTVGDENRVMILFDGEASGPYFTGIIMPGGVDTQKHKGREGSLSARYMLDGKDCDGNACRIFIENNAVDGAGYTTPTVLTDSKALAWMNSTKLTGRIDASRAGLIIRIYRDK